MNKLTGILGALTALVTAVWVLVVARCRSRLVKLAFSAHLAGGHRSAREGDAQAYTFEGKPSPCGMAKHTFLTAEHR